MKIMRSIRGPLSAPSLILCKLKGTHHKQLSANTCHTDVWCEGISSIDGSGHDEKKCTTNHIVLFVLLLWIVMVIISANVGDLTAAVQQ